MVAMKCKVLFSVPIGVDGVMRQPGEEFTAEASDELKTLAFHKYIEAAPEKKAAQAKLGDDA